MKRIIVIASVLALGACAESAPEADAAAEPEAAVEEAMADAEDGVGSYNVVYADGTEASLTVAEGGVFEVTAGEETITGTVAAGEDGSVCYTADGDDAETNCWTNGEPGEDGSWTSTDADGETVTVTQVEG